MHFEPDPLQILAGPGTGKTHVLMSRIPHLIQNHSYPPSTICALTFTRKASMEMERRLVTILGLEGTLGLMVGTFHSLSAR